MSVSISDRGELSIDECAILAYIYPVAPRSSHQTLLKYILWTMHQTSRMKLDLRAVLVVEGAPTNKPRTESLHSKVYREIKIQMWRCLIPSCHQRSRYGFSTDTKAADQEKVAWVLGQLTIKYTMFKIKMKGVKITGNNVETA